MNKKEIIAKHLLETYAVQLNVSKPFTFVSGIKSPIYCDNRILIGNTIAREAIVQQMIDMIDANDFDVIVGTATAGIPWASFIAQRLNKPMSYVRSKPKSYGASKQIEGAAVNKQRVILIEDLISTGNSSLNAIKVLQTAGAIVHNVYAIFTYNFKIALENFKEADIILHNLSDFEALISVASKEKYLSNEDAKEALLWNKDPKKWGL